MLNITIDKAYLTSLHGLNLDNAPRKYTDAEIAVFCKYAKYRIQYITDDAENDDLTLTQIEAMKEAMAITALHWIQNGWDTTRVSGSASIGGASFSSSNPDEPTYIPHLAIEILSSAGLYESLMPSSPSDRVNSGRGCGCDEEIKQLPANWMTLIDNYMASRLNAKENKVFLPVDAKTEDYMAIWNQHGRFIVTLDQLSQRLFGALGTFVDPFSTITPTDLETMYKTGITLTGRDGIPVTYIKGGLTHLKDGDTFTIVDQNGPTDYKFSGGKFGSTTIGSLSEYQKILVDPILSGWLATAGYAADGTKNIKGDNSVEDIMLWLGQRTIGGTATFKDNAHGDHGKDVDKVAILTDSLDGPAMEHALEEAFLGHKPPEIGAYELVTARWLLAAYEGTINKIKALKIDDKQDKIMSPATQALLTAAGYKADAPKNIKGDFSVEDVNLWLTTKPAGGDFDLDIKGVTKKISEWVEQNKDDIQLLSSPLKFKEYASITAAVADKGTTGFDNPSIVLIKGTTPKVYIAKEKEPFTDLTKWTEIPLTLRTHQNENGEAGWLITDVQIASNNLSEKALLEKLREIEKGNLVIGLGDFELVNAEHLAWVLKQIDKLKFKDNLAGETGPLVQDTAIATSNSAGTTQMTIAEYKAEIEKNAPTKWGQNELAKMIHIKGLYEILKGAQASGVTVLDLDDKAAFDAAFNAAKDGTPIFAIVRDLAGFPAKAFADGQTHTGKGLVYLNKAVGVSLDDVDIWIPGGATKTDPGFDLTKTNMADVTIQQFMDYFTGDLVGETEFDTKDGQTGTVIAAKNGAGKLFQVIISEPDGKGGKHFQQYTFLGTPTNGADHAFVDTNKSGAGMTHKEKEDLDKALKEITKLKTQSQDIKWSWEGGAFPTREVTKGPMHVIRIAEVTNDDDQPSNGNLGSQVVEDLTLKNGMVVQSTAGYTPWPVARPQLFAEFDLSDPAVTHDNVQFHFEFNVAGSTVAHTTKSRTAEKIELLSNLVTGVADLKLYKPVTLFWQGAINKADKFTTLTELKWTFNTQPTLNHVAQAKLWVQKVGDVLKFYRTNAYGDARGEQGPVEILVDPKWGFKNADILAGGGTTSGINGSAEITVTQDAAGDTNLALSSTVKLTLANARADHQKVADNAAAIAALPKPTPHNTVTAGTDITVNETTATDGHTNYEVTLTPATKKAITDNTAAIATNKTAIGTNKTAITAAATEAAKHTTVTAGKDMIVTPTTAADGHKNYEIISNVPVTATPIDTELFRFELDDGTTEDIRFFKDTGNMGDPFAALTVKPITFNFDSGKTQDLRGVV